MSHSSYTRMWAAAQGALEDLLVDEFPATTPPPRPQRDRVQVFQSLATFYVKYLQIFRSLEAVYNQVVHPQKRRVVRRVLDGVMGRLLELKNEMVELELSEFHFFDDVLQDLKLTPGDLEIPIPRWYSRERMQVLRDREKMLARILAKGGLIEREPISSVQTMCLEEAVRILQVSERARQGRLRAKFMREIQRAAREALAGTARRSPPTTMTPDQAATRIQKVWLGYSQRRRTKRERLEELIFLGMAPAEDRHGPSSAQQKAQRGDAGRRLLQERNEEEYQRALVDIKESVRVVDGPDMTETLQEQIRQWFIECRDATGKFPDFPNVEDGGSASIFAQKTPEQVAAELIAKEDERERKKKSKAKKDKNVGKGDQKKEKKGKGKGKKGKEVEEEEEEKGWKMTPSRFLPTVMEGSKIYKDVWRGRDDSQNFLQRFDAQLVREEKREEVEDEVRVQVDELMRQELKNLKLAVDRDKGKKKKKPKKGIKKKKKKSKKTSKRKKKKEKDLTADRSLESLYEELVLEGILIRPMNIKLSDYIGEYNYLGTTLRQAGIEPMPSLSDVRQLVALYAILPLGSHCVHEKAPLVKSLLLAGPSGVGKKMLVHAICTETGANLFNLSPGNLTGKFPGRSGLQYLLHLVFKVARQLQPSVIWIGDAEKTFYKKVPKTEKEMEPKRLKKDLAKVLKVLKPEDRVLVVGTSRRPFDADLKPFCKLYRKILLIPRPDYASRLVLWRELLHSGGVLHPGPGLDLSSLAKVTDGYTQGHLVAAVRWVLSPRRLGQLPSRALAASEFIPPLARQDPVFKEEEEAFKMWYSRTPLGKRKARAAKTIEEAELKKGKDRKSKGKTKTGVKMKIKKKTKSKKK